MRTYLLIGNYGVGNTGDEALKEYFLRTFPEVVWIPVSAKPSSGEVPRLPCGVRSFFLTPWWRTVLAYWRCTGVVFGGGSLFTDTESPLALVLWCGHAALAVLFRKPILLAFQGIGPFHTRWGEWCARWVGRRAVFLSVRDVLSFARVELWRLNKKCILSFDPVLSLVNSVNKQQGFDTFPVHTPVDRSKVLLIIPRGNSSKEFRRRMAEVQTESGNPLPPAPLPLRQERGVSRVRVVEPASFRELCAEVASASFLLTQRYHAGIVALALGVPFEAVPQVSGDKLDVLNHEDHDLLHLRERVRVGEEWLRQALGISTVSSRA